VSSINLTATYNFNQYGLFLGNSAFLRVFLETGGTFGNELVKRTLPVDSLEFYRFFKANGDFRKHIHLPGNNILAYRLNFGFAVPYGDNQILPYEKYFFAGGSNSIRAWRPRRLGPGSFSSVDSLGQYDNSFEQQGEILLETSIEFRRNLFGFLDGAVFVDAGNVWTLRNDPLRPGSQFRLTELWDQIAIGSGIGLRFDFSFLVLRLDAGVKIYDPARPSGARFLWDENFKTGAFATANTVVYNLGVGYPF